MNQALFMHDHVVHFYHLHGLDWVDVVSALDADPAKASKEAFEYAELPIATGENDLNLKAAKASKWLREGHRIKVELFLPGRTKYMEKWRGRGDDPLDQCRDFAGQDDGRRDR